MRPAFIMLLLSCGFIIAYAGRMCKRFFLVVKMEWLWCRRLGGPPRARRGRLLAVGHKAGPKVLSVPSQSPADGLRYGASWSPRGLLALVCPAGHGMEGYLARLIIAPAAFNEACRGFLCPKESQYILFRH